MREEAAEPAISEVIRGEVLIREPGPDFSHGAVATPSGLSLSEQTKNSPKTYCAFSTENTYVCFLLDFPETHK